MEYYILGFSKEKHDGHIDLLYSQYYAYYNKHRNLASTFDGLADLRTQIHFWAAQHTNRMGCIFSYISIN